MNMLFEDSANERTRPSPPWHTLEYMMLTGKRRPGIRNTGASSK